MSKGPNKTNFASLGVSDDGRCFGTIPTKALSILDWSWPCKVAVNYDPRRAKGQPSFLRFTKVSDPAAHGEGIITLKHKAGANHVTFQIQGSCKFNKMESKGKLTFVSKGNVITITCPQGFVRRGEKTGDSDERPDAGETATLNRDQIDTAQELINSLSLPGLGQRVMDYLSARGFEDPQEAIDDLRKAVF